MTQPQFVEPPIRLCCFERHFGPVCPDGTVMCCLCFGKYEQDQLAMDGGVKIDVCKDCYMNERKAVMQEKGL